MGYTTNKYYQKSMLSAYTPFKQILIPEQSVSFESVNVYDGCSINFAPGSSLIELDRPGAYLVIFNANVEKTDTSGEVNLQLQKNGENVGGAMGAEDTTAMGDIINMSFSSIIKVKPSCCAVDNTTQLSLVNTGIKAAYSNANITVIKLC